MDGEFVRNFGALFCDGTFYLCVLVSISELIPLLRVAVCSGHPCSFVVSCRRHTECRVHVHNISNRSSTVQVNPFGICMVDIESDEIVL